MEPGLEARREPGRGREPGMEAGTDAASGPGTHHRSRWAAVLPLVLATMASQALLVVLAPTVVAIGADLGAPVGTVAQARSVTAAVAIAVSLALSARAARRPALYPLRVGAVLAVLACGAVAAARSPGTFLAAHVIVGAALALLLSAGFAGLGAFVGEARAWAAGHVAAANALAWVVVNPVAAWLTAARSWRAAEAVPAVIAWPRWSRHAGRRRSRWHRGVRRPTWWRRPAAGSCSGSRRRAAGWSPRPRPSRPGRRC